LNGNYHSTNRSDLPPIINNNSLPYYDTYNSEYLTLVDNYVSSCTAKISSLKPISNISLTDQLILNTIDNISKRKDIEVKPADKNLGVVIQSSKITTTCVIKF
jgi:hypothetical protein